MPDFIVDIPRRSRVTIVDYGVGNIASIRNMLNRIGADVVLASSAEHIASAEKLILPGVGAFDPAMQRLRNSEVFDALCTRVLNDGIPVLGICLGMQLLTAQSEEGGQPGLGWIDAKTVRFDRSRLAPRDRIPHMGWAATTPTRPSRLFDGLPSMSRFYFVHSFHVDCHHEGTVSARAMHGYPFVAAIEVGNVAGVQFHPEKSHRFGMALLTNFVTRY